MLNKKRLQKVSVYVLLFLLAIGVVTYYLSNGSTGELKGHVAYKVAPEQTIQVEQKSNRDTVMKFFNGELIDEQLQQLEGLTVNGPKD